MVLPITTILITVALAFGYSNLQRSRHHHVYQAALDAFSKDVKKGMTRQQVEDLLHQKNVDFTQSMGMGTYTNDDISTLGREPTLAVCG